MAAMDDNPLLPPFRSDVAGRALWARLGAYVAVVAMLLTVCVQYHSRLAKLLRKAEDADQAYYKALAAWQEASDAPAELAKVQRTMEAVRNVKRTKGAIPRWTGAIRRFWAGENIYKPLRGGGVCDPLTGELLPGESTPPKPTLTPGQTIEEITRRPIQMHPNMPFVVILLTPLAQLPPQACVFAVNALRILALVASIFAVAAVANHRRHRMDEWVVGLAVLFAATLILSDFQHGNTNMFVLAAIAGHLWLYRKGHDFAGGAALAMAVCLKMTPALFGLYWLYQRNGKLLAGLVVTLAVAGIAVPMLAVGPARYGELTGSWLGNLILPALLKGRPFPHHINQSLPGVFTRVMMHGNIYYNPDDVTVAEEFGYINIVSLSPAVARVVLTILKAAVVGVMAWAIGWKKLPRDDARRGLHYGLVVAGMLILNQRTWDHHAVILLIAYVAVWYALAYARVGGGTRILCLVLTMAAGVITWVTRKGSFQALFGKDRGGDVADIFEAYGPTFVHFVLIFAVCVILLRALAAVDRREETLFSPKRIPLRGRRREPGTREPGPGGKQRITNNV